MDTASAKKYYKVLMEVNVPETDIDVNDLSRRFTELSKARKDNLFDIIRICCKNVPYEQCDKGVEIDLHNCNNELVSLINKFVHLSNKHKDNNKIMCGKNVRK